MVRITVLGSGDAFGSGGRCHSAYLVETRRATLLVDCGPTVLQGLKRLRLPPDRVDVVLVSHLHGDHFGGVPFLLMDYRYDSLRRRPLTIAGPRDTESRVRLLFHALYESSSLESPPHEIAWRQLPAHVPVPVAGDVQVTAFPVRHAPELECFGYRLEVEGRVIVYSGDTGWTDDLIEQVRDADLFLCECSTYETRLDLHIAYPEIATRASTLGCKRLVLTHLGREPLARLSEISLECAWDGMVIEL